MKCTWDDTQQFECGDATKSVIKGMHLRVFEDPQQGEKPIYVCEYAQGHSWTGDEKREAANGLAKELNHGSYQDVRVWQMDANGATKELSFEPYTYTTRSDHGDMPTDEFDAAVRAGHQQREQNTAFTIRDNPVPEQQQREELGEVLLSYEQRQELDFARMKGPAIEPE